MAENSKFMLRAIELSIQSAKSKGGPFGCVIVRDYTLPNLPIYLSYSRCKTLSSIVTYTVYDPGR